MLDQYRELIDELLGTPSAVRTRLSGREASAIPTAALAVVAELLQRDRLALARLQEMTRATAPHLRSLSTTGTPSPASEPAALLDAFDTARGDLVSLLMNLTLKDWERTATTDEDGVVTLADEVERHVEFDEEQRDRFARTVT